MKEFEPAITVKEIKGSKILTIPIGTIFKVRKISKSMYSECKELAINLIFNDEFQILEEDLL